MKRKLKFDKNVGKKSIVLCETTNSRAVKLTSKLFIDHSISFSKAYRHIPIFRRDKYRGASEVCIISINRNEYHRARAAIRELPENYLSRLVVNAI
jgi:hypothetical protein